MSINNIKEETTQKILDFFTKKINEDNIKHVNNNYELIPFISKNISLNKNLLQTNNNRYINRISRILNQPKLNNININKNRPGPNINIKLPKSCFMGICSNIYTGSSDFDKFFSFINYYGEFMKNKNIYVIGHSHSMQKFLKKYKIFKTYVKYSEYNISKQNLWSIVLNAHNTNNDNYSIILTRHAFSIANVAKEKGKIINQTTEIDSALSMYGILSAFNKTFDNDVSSVNTIYVSPLIRTWMSGICLYLKYCDKNEFNIVISPYIIEDGGLYDNRPRKFADQIQYFEIFLNVLKKINNIKILNNDISINNFEKKVIIVYDGRSNKMCTFKFNNGKWKGVINDKNISYFQKNNIEYPPLMTVFSKLLSGVNKPNSYALKKISRWCEPLAMKGYFNYSDKKVMCRKKLNKD